MTKSALIKQAETLIEVADDERNNQVDTRPVTLYLSAIAKLLLAHTKFTHEEPSGTEGNSLDV